jgi:hypothetical protein
MDIIPCGEGCKYQKDGYCSLKRISQVSAESYGKCAHYTPISKGSADNRVKGVTDIPDSDNFNAY